MEKEKTITLKGISRNPYIFTIYPWSSAFWSVSAVYAVLRRNRYGYVILYIGETCDLRKELIIHPERSSFDQAGKTHIGIHIEPVVSRRQAKETDLIASYAPVLNMEGKKINRA